VKTIIIKGIDRNDVIRFIIESGQKLPPGIIAGKDWKLIAEAKEEASKGQQK
jgi:hypothetical protein